MENTYTETPEPKPRGTARLLITADILVSILQGLMPGGPRYFEVTKNPVPPDAKLEGYYIDPENGTVELRVSSKAWEGDLGLIPPTEMRVATQPGEATPNLKPNPQDKEYLAGMAGLLSKHLPDNYGFILLAMPFGESPRNRTAYVASVERTTAIAALKEFLIRCGHEETWMKHIN